MNFQTLLQDMGTVALGVVLVLAIVKPLLDLALPDQMPDAAYNSLYQIVGVLLNFGGLVGYLAAQGHLDLGQYWYLYLAAAFAQQVGSHAVYQKVKASVLAGQSGQSAAPVPTTTTNAIANTAHSAVPVFPAALAPSATSPAAPAPAAPESTPVPVPAVVPAVAS